MADNFCVYKVNQTGELNADVLNKFPGGVRNGYTVLECGYKTHKEALKRMDEIEKEEKSKK